MEITCDPERLADPGIRLTCRSCGHRISRSERNVIVEQLRSADLTLAQALDLLSQAASSSAAASSADARKALLSRSGLLLSTAWHTATGVLHPGNLRLPLILQLSAEVCKRTNRFAEAVAFAKRSFAVTNHYLEDPVHRFNSLFRLIDCLRFLLLRIRCLKEERRPRLSASQSPSSPSVMSPTEEGAAFPFPAVASESASLSEESAMREAAAFLDTFERMISCLLGRTSQEAAFFQRQVCLTRRLLLPYSLPPAREGDARRALASDDK